MHWLASFGLCALRRLNCANVSCGLQLGGFIGDWAASRYPNHGRVVVAQVSVGLGVPLSIAMFKASLLSN